MSTTKASLTVTFEAPFWIGLYKRESDGAYEVCKITFGAEPKDYEVYEFLLRNWQGLSFSPKLQSSTLSERRLNPKRLQREIKRQLEPRGIGTKAQEALKLQHGQNKKLRQSTSREAREAEKVRRFLQNRSSAGKAQRTLKNKADR